jgi:hypothetical protein
MGAYKTVTVTRLVPCPRCDDMGQIQLQFTYDMTQQLRYALGDEIVWGANDIGVPSAGEVDLLGTPECCATCGLDVAEEYVISAIGGRLASYRLATPEDVAPLP